jgi:hypothetical protein
MRLEVVGISISINVQSSDQSLIGRPLQPGVDGQAVLGRRLGDIRSESEENEVVCGRDGWTKATGGEAWKGLGVEAEEMV